MTNYLLEKPRVVAPGQDERSFHVFYQVGGAAVIRHAHAMHMPCTCHAHPDRASPYNVFHQLLAGGGAEARELHLAAPESFELLRRSGCVSVRGTNDEDEYRHMREARPPYSLHCLTLSLAP